MHENSDHATACAKIEIFRTNRCPELQTYSKETGPTRYALQAPSQHRRSSFWTLTQPIREPTSLKLAQTDPKWPRSDRAIWRANGRARPKPRAGRHVKRRQSAHHVCTCVCRHQLPPDHDPRGHMRATAVSPVATSGVGARDRPIHSTSRHDPGEMLGGLSSAALELHAQPATHALPSQQSSPSTPECKERNHRYKCRSGWAGRVMRSTVHEARQGEAREPMRVRWLLRTAHSRRYVRTRSRMLSNASECAANCARARGVHARIQSTSYENRPSSRLHEAQQGRTRVIDGGL